LIYAGVRQRDRRTRAIEALRRVGLGERTTHRPTDIDEWVAARPA